MNRKGFTLIELIFVMIVIGILTAVALPKFRYLKENAHISNMIAAYTTLMQNGAVSLLNETELNEVPVDDLNLTNILKVPAYNYNSDTGRGWRKTSETNIYYYAEPSKYMQFTYYKTGTNAGNVRIYTYISGKNKEHFQKVLNKKLGLIFDGDKNTTYLNLHFDE